MSCPEGWVKSHKTEFELFGTASEELSRDELLATVGWLTGQLEQEREPGVYGIRLFVGDKRVGSRRLSKAEASHFAVAADHLSKYLKKTYGVTAEQQQGKLKQRGMTIASLQAKLTAAKRREKALTRKLDEVSNQRDTYRENETLALKSWLKALGERDEARLSEEERASLAWLSGYTSLNPAYREHARVAKSLLERSKC